MVIVILLTYTTVTMNIISLIVCCYGNKLRI